MFLSMLAGDVASAHGHEFSRTPTTPPAGTTQVHPLGRRLTLPRAVLPSTRQKSPHGPSPLGPLVRRATTPARAASVKLTMAELKEEPEEDVEEEDSRHSEDSLSAFRMPGAFRGSSHTQEPIKPSGSFPIASTGSPVQTIISSPDFPLDSPTIFSPMSLNTSPTTTFEESSIAAVTKRTRGPKSTLRFAHPIPTRPLGKHGILRPKTLLQLQQRRESGFHRPLYDVLPANRFAPRTKIGQKIHRLHGGKDGLEADDLVVINAEDYSVSDTISEEIESADPRAVVGVISPTFSATVAATVAEFTLENTVWCIKVGLNGASYTLESQCDTPQIARWYIPKRKRNSVIVDGSVIPAAKDGRKFYFTTILPGSKQHPIIASMTETSLELNDSYYVASREGEIITDDTTRKLIIMSAAWVFFMEGWSNNYKVKPRTNSCPKPTHARANSLPVEPTRRRSIFTTSPARSPSLQPTPIEGVSRSSSLRSSEAPSLVSQRLPGAFFLPEIDAEPEQDEPRLSSSTIVVDRQASQITTSDALTQDQQAHLQSSAPKTSPVEAWTTLRSRAPGSVVVSRVRDESSNDEKARKRRSWGHHELKPRVSSLARSMSHRLRRDRPIVLTAEPACDIPIASIEEQPSSPHAKVRHFRRISQHLRHLDLAKPDATNITAEVLLPFTPHQSSTSPPRPTTGKSVAPSEKITFDRKVLYNAPPKADVDFAARDSKKPPPRIEHPPVTMDALMAAAQSTDTIPDPAQVSWWQQYDQFIVKDNIRKMERNCSPVVERYSLEQSQRVSQEFSQEPLRSYPQEVGAPVRTPSKKVKAPLVEVPPENMSSSVYNEAQISGCPVVCSRRLSVWKGKLRAKLHV